MSKRTGFRSVCIRPREDFGSFSDAVQLAGADGSIDLSPRLFDVPALAVLVDKQGMPMWLPHTGLRCCDTSLVYRVCSTKFLSNGHS